MKKILNISIFFCIFSTLICCEIKKIDKSEEMGGTFLHKDEDVDYVYDDAMFLVNNFSTQYYKRLKDNFGNNIKGSCGYVALAMLLSYYDTYWDDTMISESFDICEEIFNGNLFTSITSPGVKKETYDMSDYSNQEYYTEIVNKSNEYFHSYLIRLGEEEHGLYHSIIPEYPCMLLKNGFRVLLEEYLYDVKEYNSNMIAIEECNDSSLVRSFIIDRVLLGIPVVGYLSASVDKKHFVIFYDYDQSEDELYAHFGWHGTEISSHIRFSSATNYSTIEAAFALDINTSHVCGNNYRDYDTNERLCSCYFNIHPEHDHNYINYTNFNELKHNAQCHCGYSTFLPHIVREGTSVCILCGGRVDTGFATFGSRLLINPINKLILTNSYILENDVIVISDIDYSSIVSNNTKNFYNEA